MRPDADQSPALSPQRLFSDPPLTAAMAQQVTLIETPEGDVVLFLLEREGHRNELVLWRADPGLAARPWLTGDQLAAALPAPAGAENEAERAARERLRQFSGGVTSFAQRGKASQLLVPYEGQALLVSLEDSDVQCISKAEGRLNALSCSPSGRWLTYVRSGDLYLEDIDGTATKRLTADATETVCSGLADFIAQEEMHRFEGYWWDPQERYLAYQRTDESPIPVAYRHDIQADRIDVVAQRYPYAGGPNATVELVIYDLEADSRCQVPWAQAEDDYLGRVDWLAGALWLQVQSRDQQRLRVLRVDPNTREQHLVFEEAASTWINLHNNLAEGPAGQFFWTSERDGYSRLYLGSTGNGTLQVLSPEGQHVNRVLRFSAGKVWYEGWQDTPTEQHLFSLSVTENGAGAIAQLSEPGGWHSAAVSASGKTSALARTSLAAPPLVLTCVEAHDRPQPILETTLWDEHPYRPLLPAHRTPELGTVTADDGTALHYRLTRPEQASDAVPVPALVYVYGGPGVQRVRNEWSPLLLQLLAGAGYAVLELDNRGSHGRGHAFEAPIHQALGTVEVLDQLAGTQWLQQLSWIDEERVGVFGHSYGGYMTLRCLIEAPEVFRAGVSIAPVADWRLYDTHYTERYLGLPADEADSYEAAGLLGSLATLRRPLQLVHGMADDNVLFANTTALIAELQQALVPFELMTYPGSKHALQETHVSIHRFNALLKFFDTHLKA
jgi:dipeptidyl-peptidase-4